MSTAADRHVTPPVDRVLIHRNLWDSEDTCDRVQGLVNWVNRVLFECFYEVDEVPTTALQSYYVDYYLAQVNNGGLSQFVFNSRWNPKTVAFVRDGLAAMGASRHAKLFAELARSVDGLGKDLGKFLESEYFGTNDIREKLDRLTSEFYALNKTEDLTGRNHAWIATFPNVDVAEGAAFTQRWEAYAQLDAVRTTRKAAAEKAAEENASPLEKFLKAWCAGKKRSFDQITAIDIDGIHFFADGKKFAAQVDGARMRFLDADDREIDSMAVPAELLRQSDDAGSNDATKPDRPIGIGCALFLIIVWLGLLGATFLTGWSWWIRVPCGLLALVLTLPVIGLFMKPSPPR